MKQSKSIFPHLVAQNHVRHRSTQSLASCRGVGRNVWGRKALVYTLAGASANGGTEHYETYRIFYGATSTAGIYCICLRSATSATPYGAAHGRTYLPSHPAHDSA